MQYRLKRPGLPGEPAVVQHAPLGEAVREVLDALGVKPGEEFTVTDGKMPESARTRRTDPNTSKAAAESIDDLRASQRAVLVFFGWQPGGGGMTDEELIKTYNAARARALRNGGMTTEYPKQSDSGLRSRRAELVDGGFLMDSGERRKLGSGRKATVWKLTPEYVKPPKRKPPQDPLAIEPLGSMSPVEPTNPLF